MGELKVDKIEVSISDTNSSYYPVNTKITTGKVIDAFVGDEFLLSAEVYPENIVNKNVTYSSSNKQIATISKDGDVKVVGTGTCSITCKAVFGGKTISFTINSYEHLQSVSFDKSSKIKTLETPVYSNGVSISKYVELEVGETLDMSYAITPTKHHPNVITKMVCGYFDRYGDFQEGYTYAEAIGNTIRAKQIGECYLFASAGENLVDNGNGRYKEGYDSIVVGDVIQVRVIPTAVKQVSLNKSSLSLQIGENETLIATIFPENATNKNVSWSSSDTNVASVDNYGKVAGKKSGTVTITATADGSIKATCQVEVSQDVKGISLNKTELQLEPNETETLIATINPANATNKNIVWTSSKSEVASVDSTGKITALSVGDTTITATSQDGGFNATCQLTVLVKTRSISLNKESLEMEVGDKETLTPTILPANATNKNITWASSNENVASVDNQGKIIAKSSGDTIVTAKTEDGNFTATCGVNVIVKVTGITLSKTSLQMEVGGKETITAIITPSNATEKSVTWVSSNEKVAVVSDAGNVTGIGIGDAIITCTTVEGNKTATCSVTVEPVSNFLTFESESEFTITSRNGNGGKSWDGTLFYSKQNPSNIVNISEIQEWDGNTITSAYNNGKYYLYIFGKDNTKIIGKDNYSVSYRCRWKITGSNVSCLGDIRTLLNYTNVENTTMESRCFAYMFYDCTSLTSAPALPATTLADYCYSYMFYGCSSLKFSATKDEANGYVNEYKLGSGGGGSELFDMFYGIGGTFTGRTPSYGQTLWTKNSIAREGDNPHSIAFTTPELTLVLGETDVLGLVVSPINSSPNATFRSENEQIAKVSGNGIITAVSLGSTKVTATTPNGKTATCSVTVEPINNFLTFESESEFKITSNNGNGGKSWNGTLYYLTQNPSNFVNNSVLKDALKEWDGNTITSAYNNGKYYLYIFGKDNTSITNNSDNRWVITGSNVSCLGDIRTLLNYTNVENTTMESRCFACMFWGCGSLTSAPALPATTLASSCYSYMFYGCTSLTSAPALPVTTLASSCYSYMFSGCTSLTSAPALPATTLKVDCYSHMFSGCSSLTSAPALPATTIEHDCYSYMFYGCTSLTSAPALPATTLALYCYSNMFSGCTSLKFSATKDESNGYVNEYKLGSGSANNALSNMFSNTSGTFKGTPTSGQTFWTSNEVIYPEGESNE